jgi:hypothetical protein
MLFDGKQIYGYINEADEAMWYDGTEIMQLEDEEGD